MLDLTEEQREENLGELGYLYTQLKKYADTNLLKRYKPYQKQREFHASGKHYRERCLIAANQVGKTWCAGAEVSMHLTGQYPDWWNGMRMSKGNKWWVAGVTGESTRDNPQRILLGQKRNYGTGMIPADCIKDVQLARGTPDLVDSVVVQHITGQESYLWFKSYEKGREKWQGETLDGIWDDEEPPMDIYTEGLTRLNVTRGPVLLTFTPLLGMSEVVRRFLQPEEAAKASRFYVNMTLDDAEHYNEDDKASLIAQYPDWEREARTAGVPMLGSGRIYPIDGDAVKFSLSQFQDGFPAFWPALGAVDFGDWDHPTAGVWLRWDRDTDTIYIYDCYRVRREKLAVHTKSFAARGKWMPVAWPHDGHKHDRSSGEPVATLWRNDGVNMLRDHAQWPEGGISVEAGITQILDRLQTGRLKVADHLNDWWDEFRLYHRKDGRIVKEHDDLMDATRYAIMDLTKSRLPGGGRKPKVSSVLDSYSVFD